MAEVYYQDDDSCREVLESYMEENLDNSGLDDIDHIPASIKRMVQSVSAEIVNSRRELDPEAQLAIMETLKLALNGRRLTQQEEASIMNRLAS